MSKSNVLIVFAAAAFIAFSFTAGGCGKSGKEDISQTEKKTQESTETIKVADGEYVCPMHPLEQSNDVSAKCPVCKMNMISKKEHNNEMSEMHENMEKKFAGQKDAIHFEVNLSVIKSDECERFMVKALKSDPGVLDFHIDIINKVIHMYIDKSKTSKENVEKLISDAGFDANNTKANPDAAGKLPEACK